MIRSPAEILLLLEQECLAVDRAIAARAWSVCDASWRVQRKLTHELDISMRGIAPGSPEMLATQRRIERLRRYRDGQIQRLVAFNQNIAKRLTTVGRFRNFSKQRVTAERVSRLLDFKS